jgi:molybdate/tungstate transport system ATP-binding protein
VIALHRVSARVGAFRLVDVSFEVPRGGYAVVIGPAGAGKTTLLETIAGVIRTTDGRIIVDGDDVTAKPPEARRLAIVYQHSYLFPHLSVRENVAYGARASAADVIERFGLTPLLDRPPAALSGGERQIVAIARALARDPGVLLLDEPFSALDPRTRNHMRRLVRAWYHDRNVTVLHVTHDFAEAGLLGDVAIMLDHGRVLQQGTPEEIFRKPANPYVADFLGAENVFDGVAHPIRADAPDTLGAFDDPGGASAERPVAFTTGGLTFYALGDLPAGPAHAIIRAEEISLSAEPSPSSVQNQFRGCITDVAPAGAITRVTVDVRGTPIVAAVTARSVRELGLAVGGQVVVGFKATAVHLC